MTLSRKYPPPTSEAAATAEGDEAPKRHVLLVDMGAAATNVAVIGVDEEPGMWNTNLGQTSGPSWCAPRM